MNKSNFDDDMNIDINLYSRQLGSIGTEAMLKFSKMEILILGLRGLGVEILKDLILEGPKRVDIYDPNFITINDLNSNFLVTKNEVGKRRDNIIIEKIKGLNPNVESKILNKNNKDNENNYISELSFICDNIKNYNLIIISEFVSKTTITQINTQCKKNNKALIYACVMGLCGFLFNYFGNEHIITSPYERDDNLYPIKKIKKGEKTIIYLEKSLEGYPDIEEGYIKLRDINGMKELNVNEIYKTKVHKFSEFEINVNSTNYTDYTYGGFLQVITLPKKMKFRTFEEDIKNPMENKEREFIYIPYIGRNDIVHSLIYSLYQNEQNYDKSLKKQSYLLDSDLLLDSNDDNYSKILISYANKYFISARQNEENWIKLDEQTFDLMEFDEKMIKNLSLHVKKELPPITSFLGGVVAQEALKLTGKFSPFNQWFEFEFNYLSKEYNKISVEKNINEENVRYKEQIEIFGQEVQDKLNSLNIFLIGAGAIGCEYLKNFAMMGVSSKEGTLTLTDFDKIELSNLNRQFLFRENNIGQFKSEVAKYYTKIMNNSLNIKDYKNIVSPETENIFTDSFWDKQDIIFNAVDNMKARFYISDKVSIHQKYHVDAGTLGVDSSSCFILKNLSSTYKEQNQNKKDNDGLIETGMCTVHSFPTSIKHCIQWARNEYEYIFKDFIIELKEITKGNSQYLYKILLKKIYPFYKDLKLKEINKYFDIYFTRSYIKAIEYSYYKYKNKFNFEIEDILKEHPPNSKDKDGNNFYSGSLHEPRIIDFNISDDMDKIIICYVKSYANLIFDSLGLMKSRNEINLEDLEIKDICLKTKIENYDDNDKKSLVSSIKYDKDFCQKFVEGLQKKLKEILLVDTFEKMKLNEIIFKKDSITNSQFDFIYACTNLKAYNYQIPQSDFISIKAISSNIIPSIITSNAVITGLVSMQLYLLAKLLIEKEKYNNNLIDSAEALKIFRNYYIGLGFNNYTYSNLPQKQLHSEKNDIPNGWSVWDSIIFKGPMKMSEFIHDLENRYNIKLKSVHSGNSMIYNENDPDEIKNMIVEKLYEKINQEPISSFKKYLIFKILATDIFGNEVNLPRIKYCL